MDYQVFYKSMSKLENEELLAIINEKRHAYVPDALKAAEDVFRQRGCVFTLKSEEEIRLANEKKTSMVDLSNQCINARFMEFFMDQMAIVIFSVCISLLIGVNIGILTYFLYYLTLEALWGITIGKLIMGLQVVDADGNKPSIGAISIRTLCRFIPLDPISFCFCGWNSACWHDSLSKTYTVRREKLEEMAL